MLGIARTFELDSDSRVGRDLAQSFCKYCFDSFFRVCHEKGANYTSGNMVDRALNRILLEIGV
jgi:hypothetical protein